MSRSQARQPDIDTAIRERPAPALGRLLPLAVIATAFVALTAWSWMKWSDPLIDFGHELFLPWQLAQGRTLYRDLRYIYGPLSPYLNALLFVVFGPSVRTLVLANLALLAALTAMVYRLVFAACGRFTATACCLVLLGVFSFSQYSKTGNFNFVTPYVHETTHGTLLIVAMMVLLLRYAEHRGTGAVIGAGICLGLTLLTKPEIILAAGSVALVAGIILGLSDRRPAALRGRDVLLFMAGAIVPTLGFLAYFATRMPAGAALRGALGVWSAPLFSPAARTEYYVRGMGLDRPWANLLAAIGWSAAIAWGAAAAAALDLACRRPGSPARRMIAIAAGAAAFAGLLLAGHSIPWKEVPRGLVVVCLVAACAMAADIVRRRADPEHLRRRLPLAMWTAFSLAMLAKMALHVRITHYGFFLAMPVTLLVVALLVHVLPDALRGRSGGGIMRGVSVGIVAAGVAYHLHASHVIYRQKDLVVGTGPDAFLAFRPAFDPAGAAVEEARRWIEINMPADADFVVMPEGSILNYLTRRPNRGTCHHFTPTEVLGFGEERMLQELEASRPQYVILAHRDSSEFGFNYFGEDPRYGKTIVDWVQRDYLLVQVIGSMPLQDRRFGIAILQRKSDDHGQHRNGKDEHP